MYFAVEKEKKKKKKKKKKTYWPNQIFTDQEQQGQCLSYRLRVGCYEYI